MKRVIITGVFVFSLALNAAVGATLCWHLWLYEREQPPPKGRYALSERDFKEIKKLWKHKTREHMILKRRQVMEKRIEILDLLSKDPSNPGAADKPLEELIAVRAEMEKEAVEHIRTILAELPQERRQAFVDFLKQRACKGKDKGMGWGKRFHPGGPGGQDCPHCPGMPPK